MKKCCPWCSKDIPGPAALPEGVCNGQRVALCPHCRKAIRVSRKELLWSAAALPFGLAYLVNWFAPAPLVPEWALWALALPVALAAVKIKNAMPEKVYAV